VYKERDHQHGSHIVHDRQSRQEDLEPVTSRRRKRQDAKDDEPDGAKL
jgi:hypothetical protein